MVSAEDRARVLRAITRIEDDLSERGITVVGSLGARLHALARQMEHERAPRITVVGRRGAGKSSLLNAIANASLAKTGAVEDTTGEPSLYSLTLRERSAQWIDTGGLRAGGASEHRADMLCEVLSNEPPDVLLFVHAASEADAAIDADLTDLRRAVDESCALHDRTPTIIALATRVDELDPPDVFEPPFDDETKRGNISAAVRSLRGALARHDFTIADALPINTWFSTAHDLRWNIDALTDLLVSRLPAHIDERTSADELHVLLHRVSDALATVVARTATATDERAREWFIATLRRLGPVAARSGDRAEIASRPGVLASPSQWLTASLQRTGVRALAHAVSTRTLRALGERIVDAMFEELSTRSPLPR